MDNNDKNEILLAIDTLGNAIEKRVDRLEEAVFGTKKSFEALEQKQSEQTAQISDIAVKQSEQSDQIDELFRRIDQLSSAPIWRSKGKRQVALKREDVDDVFEDLRINRMDGLKTMSDRGKLVKGDGNHYAKRVRVSGQTVRAIVIWVK